MKFKFAMFIALVVLVIAISACGADPTATPTPLPTAVPQPTLVPQPTQAPKPAPTTIPLPAATPLPTTIAATPTRVSPSTTPPPPPTATATPAPKQQFLNVFNTALSKIKTYRVEITEDVRQIDVVLPDRFRVNSTDFLVRIAQTVYIYDLNGKVQARYVADIPFIDRSNLIWLRDQFAVAAEHTYLGPGNVDNIPAIGYSLKYPLTKVGSGGPGKTPEVVFQVIKVWFSVKEGFPLLIEYGAPMPLHVYFYDFNATIEILPPQ
jgi:hypothetical protein